MEQLSYESPARPMRLHWFFTPNYKGEFTRLIVPLGGIMVPISKQCHYVQAVITFGAQGQMEKKHLTKLSV